MCPSRSAVATSAPSQPTRRSCSTSPILRTPPPAYKGSVDKPDLIRASSSRSGPEAEPTRARSSTITAATPASAARATRSSGRSLVNSGAGAIGCPPRKSRLNTTRCGPMRSAIDSSTSNDDSVSRPTMSREAPHFIACRASSDDVKPASSHRGTPTDAIVRTTPCCGTRCSMASRSAIYSAATPNLWTYWCASASASPGGMLSPATLAIGAYSSRRPPRARTARRCRRSTTPSSSKLTLCPTCRRSRRQVRRCQA